MIMSNAVLLGLMTSLFLVLGYLGVPVAFALIAGVLVGTAFTPISFQSMIAQLFNGIDSEALMAIPFFLLVGELMTSANVVIRIAELSQALLAMCAAAWRRSPRYSQCFSPACPARRPPTSPCCRAPWPSRWRPRATGRSSPPR
jgi:predicted histidine transporter YuiF (NhaC family)